MPHEKRLEWVWESTKGTPLLVIRAFEKMDLFHFVPQGPAVYQMGIADVRDLRNMLDQIIAEYYGGVEA